MSNTRKKIFYVTPDFPIGGAERFLVLLANHLAAHTSEQRVISFGNNTALKPELDPSISFDLMNRRSRRDIRPYLQLRRLIRREQPNLIICLNFFAYLATRMATLFTGYRGRIVVSYHSTIHLQLKEHRMHKLYARLLRKKDRVITVSNNQARYALETYPMPPSCFVTIHNGIDTAKWTLAPPDFSRTKWREQWHIPPSAKIIISVAALRHEKNHLGAVRALKILHDTYHSHAYLLLVGDGNMRAQIEEEAIRSNLLPFIRFAGNQQDVRPFCWMSDLFTLCSTSETFSLAALEAMACGLPAVLADIGGANEMINDPSLGLICSTDNESFAKTWHKALETKWDPDHISATTQNQFSIETMFARYREELLK